MIQAGTGFYMNCHGKRLRSEICEMSDKSYVLKCIFGCSSDFHIPRFIKQIFLGTYFCSDAFSVTHQNEWVLRSQFRFHCLIQKA